MFVHGNNLEQKEMHQKNTRIRKPYNICKKYEQNITNGNQKI